MLRYYFSFIVLLLLWGCSAPHHSMQALPTCYYPNIFPSDTITISYFDGVLEKAENKRAARWAKRKGYQFLAVELLNNTDQTIRGFQLQFYDGKKRLKTVSNKWAARKVRQRIGATPFICFFTGIAEFLFWQAIDSNDDDDTWNNIDDNDNIGAPISHSVAGNENKHRKQANTSLLEELERMEIFRRTLHPGQPVYGILVVESSHLPKDLRVKILDMDAI